MKNWKLVLAAIALAGSVTSILKAEDNPWLCKKMKCEASQTCPTPEAAPNCNKTTKTACEAVKRPNTYGCDAGSASSCVEGLVTDNCQSSGNANECGAAECAYCQWDTDLKKCVMVGECTMGPCNQPCSS